MLVVGSFTVSAQDKHERKNCLLRINLVFIFAVQTEIKKLKSVETKCHQDYARSNFKNGLTYARCVEIQNNNYNNRYRRAKTRLLRDRTNCFAKHQPNKRFPARPDHMQLKR